MPWQAADAAAHVHGLTAHQRAIWARVANAALRTCRRAGGALDECEGRALRQAAAVAQRAPAKSVKVAADGALEILAIPFSGPWAGKDLDGDYFSDATDLCLDWFPTERPLLYHHGLDPTVDAAPIGRVDVTTAHKTGAGWWVRAELDRSHTYWQEILALLDDAEGPGLFASSGAMAPLIRKASDGEILRWPWVELSLTPTPANFFALVAPADAKAHYKAAGLTLPPGAGQVAAPAPAPADAPPADPPPADPAPDPAAGKAGRRFSAASEQQIRAAIAALEDLLGVALEAADADAPAAAAAAADAKAPPATPPLAPPPPSPLHAELAAFRQLEVHLQPFLEEGEAPCPR